MGPVPQTAATSPAAPAAADELTRFRDHLKAERDAAFAEAAVKHGTERQVLLDKIDELNRRLANPEEALAQQHAIILALQDQLARRGNDLGGDVLETARKALADKDFDAARHLWERISHGNDPAVQAKADAEYALGLIAEEQVRWLDAATHYESAARLNPTYDTLVKAGEFLWRAGRHEEALAAERKLVALSRSTHGPQAPLTATALNNLAETLRALGLYDQAEPLYREALEIGRATLGDRHPAVATWANNLAGLLQATGCHDQAEPLYREALEIRRDKLGLRHPDVGQSLNNLACLLQATGRHDQAEPLYREALEIGRATLGDRHPAVMKRLNNLAGLLRNTGRPDQATPLYLEALAIYRASFGDTHPGTRTIAGNTLIHLRQHAPLHPDLPALAAAFPGL